jgi:hypothetical protein
MIVEAKAHELRLGDGNKAIVIIAAAATRYQHYGNNTKNNFYDIHLMLLK